MPLGKNISKNIEELYKDNKYYFKDCRFYRFPISRYARMD